MSTPEGRNIGYTPGENQVGGYGSPGSADGAESAPAILSISADQLRQKVALLGELGISPAEVRGEPQVFIRPSAQGSPETS